MIQQRNNIVWGKLNALVRYIMLHTSTRAFPLYVVNEYPKSGGSWVGEMIGDALGVPFPRNRLPVLGASIMHGHLMHSWNMHNVLLVWRDGRDVLVSQYFHWLFKNERGNARLVDQCRKDLQFDDYEDVEGNLVAFMTYVYEHSRHPRFTWAEFVGHWSSCKTCIGVRYEDIRSQPESELSRVLEKLAGCTLSDERIAEIVDNHSFARLTGRKAGEEDASSFMRKGIVGDWKNYFTPEARRKFNEYAGQALIKLGYEQDERWVEEG